MEIMTWLLGSLENRSFDHVWIALPCIAAGAMMLLWNGRALDALTLGEDAAQALGTDLRRTRLRLLVGTAIGVGGAVAVSGAIGFVGLIRSEEHTSELQSLMRISYAVFCLKKKKKATIYL